MAKSKKEGEGPRLNDRQRLFVVEYVACLNATKAALRAGYSDKTARSIGQENLTKPDIRAEIDRLLKERAMSPDEIIERLEQHARGDHAEYWDCSFGENPHLDIKRLIADGKAHLIKSVSRDGKTGKVTKIEFHDSQAALVHLGRHHKLFTDKTDLSSSDGTMTPTAISFVPHVSPDSNNS